MKKHLSIILVTVTVVTLLASSAFAWRSIRTGQKNFQRAWRAYIMKQPDRAAGYYAKAADAFGEALAETPPSRTTTFPSNLAMAGISFYNAGRYDESVKAMGMAAKQDKRLWETYLYAALCQMRTGNAAEAVNALNAYLDSSPTQAILSAEVKKQIEELETEQTNMESNWTALERAMFQQSKINHTTSKRNPPQSSIEDCNGAYWWRYNIAPCIQDTQTFR